MLDISIQSNISEISKKLNDLAYRELPFVAARTATELAKMAQGSEKAEMLRVFDRPRTFTANSVAIQPAAKSSPVARVYVRDIAARYLEPYEDGDDRFLAGTRKWQAVPRNAPLDANGNLRRRYMETMKVRPDCFVGIVQTKHGPINGLWQRTTRYEVVDKHGKKRTSAKSISGGRRLRGLRLLVEFKPTTEVRKHLDFGGTAQKVVSANVDKVFGRFMAQAIASSKLKH